MIAGDRPYEEGVSGVTTVLKTNIGYKTIITTDEERFCNTLLDMASVAGSRRCTPNELFDAVDGAEPTITIPSNLIDSPTFTSTSGKRYYLSTRVAEGNNVSEHYGYRVMAVDLNGAQTPNISAPVTGSPALVPDIVTFVILDNGEIFPVDVAANNYSYTARGKTYNVIYINSKLKGYYYSDVERGNVGVPQDCFRKSGDETKAQVCNYAVVYIPNPYRTSSGAFYSYREAYCASLGGRGTSYPSYCSGLAGNSLCPPSTAAEQFDVCRVENVKPAFRYNF